MDIAVGLGRICRWAGGCSTFYPVLLHSFVVADLLPRSLKLRGLLHDSTEVAISDIPGPFKPEELKKFERAMLKKILTEQSIPEANADEEAAVKLADTEALLGEAWTIGAPGLQEFVGDRSPRAEERTLYYLGLYAPNDYLEPGGRAVREFFTRYAEYLSFSVKRSAPSVRQAGCLECGAAKETIEYLLSELKRMPCGHVRAEEFIGIRDGDKKNCRTCAEMDALIKQIELLRASNVS